MTQVVELPATYTGSHTEILAPGLSLAQPLEFWSFYQWTSAPNLSQSLSLSPPPSEKGWEDGRKREVTHILFHCFKVNVEVSFVQTYVPAKMSINNTFMDISILRIKLGVGMETDSLLNAIWKGRIFLWLAKSKPLDLDSIWSKIHYKFVIILQKQGSEN